MTMISDHRAAFRRAAERAELQETTIQRVDMREIDENRHRQRH